MTIRAIYNTLLLPDVSYYFKKDFFPNQEPVHTGADILFMLLKNEKEDGNYTPEDFYPIGISARIEGDSEGDTVHIRTLDRMDFSMVEIENGQINAAAAIRPEIQDMSEEEEKEEFGKLRTALLKFVQGYQWGLWARSFILQRKNMNDLVCALSDYLNLSPDDKYAILAADSRRERYELITRAANEFMELSKVAEEAKTAQKDNQEQLYREAALKKQIDYLQKELDDMHPENVSDVRKFEKKIASSGMNKEAKQEAEKVLNRMRQEGKESHEYGMLYDYLDFVTSLSWKTPRMPKIDLDKAQAVLDEEHYGLKKVNANFAKKLH